MIEAALGRLSAGIDLSMEEMSATIDTIMQGRCSDGEIGLLLTTLRAKGETVAEVAGAAAALRRHMVPIRSYRDKLVDTCGTGGDGSGTFNISTAAAIVAAAAGVSVAKHGNRRVSSRSGSADVLAALGVNIEASVRQVEVCLEELGICFCFAPLMHPAMMKVREVRRKLGVPTIFNMLGPLANPAQAPYQLVGVGRPDLRPLLAEALLLLGARRALVVCGDDGLDEVTLSGSTRVSEVTPAGIREYVWSPHDFGLAQASSEELQEQLKADGPTQSAEIIRSILDGTPGPSRDIVVMNAAAAVLLCGHETEPLAAARRAAAAIDSGAAKTLLGRLAERSFSGSTT